jgi:hypothetical protein
MTIQPVQNASAPGYPEKSRRLAVPLMAGLTAALALGLNACGERVTMGEPLPIPTETCTVQAAETTEYIIMGEPTAPVPIPEAYITAGLPVQIPVTEVSP